MRPFAELARSGTAVVYKAYQASLERVVLLKRLLPEVASDVRVVERFEDESRLIARIDHPNVVRLHSFGHDDTSPYLVAEFVDGMNLAEVIARGPLPSPLAVFVLREAVRGVGAAHERGILHRDIKPANILVSFEGQVKVTDFGFASLVDDDDELREVRGTLAYLAPEQVRGEAPDVSTDFFALGATLFEMIMGRRAFLGTESGAILESILHFDPVPQLAGRSDVPAEVVGICGRMLTRFSDERYADWEELEADCSAYLTALDRPVDEATLAAYLEDPDSVEIPAHRSTPTAEDVSPARATQGSNRPDWRIAIPATLMAFTILFVVAALSGYFGRGAGGDPMASRVIEDVRYPLWLYPLGPDGREQGASEDASDAEESDVEEQRGDTRGALRVSVDPWANVVVGQDTLGRTPLADRVFLEPGRHRVRFLHPEFPVVERVVNVRAGGDHEMIVSMWESVGRLRLEVSPWAAVSIDGIPRDTIPPQPRPYVLAPGRYRLTLDHPALGRYDTDVQLSAGEERTLRFNLYELLR